MPRCFQFLLRASRTLARPALCIGTLLICSIGILLLLDTGAMAGDERFETRLLATIPPDAQVEHQGVTETHFDDIERTGFPFLSPDGKTAVYLDTRGSRVRVFRGESFDPPYELAQFIVKSQDGKRIAYQAYEKDRWCAVIDGKPDKKYDMVREICFSPDGKRVGYVALEEGKWYVIIDGEKYGHGWVGARGLAFSPDSKRIAFAGNPGNSMWSVVVDGQVGREYDDIIGRILFSPDSTDYAYVARESKRDFAVKGGSPQKRFNGVSGLTFLGAAQGIAYVGTRGRTCELIAGRSQFAPYRAASTPILDARKTPCFAASDGQKVFIMHGQKKRREFPQLGSSIVHLEIRPDAKGCVYIAQDSEQQDKQRVVINQKPGPRYLRVYPRLFHGPRRKAVAYIGQVEPGKVQVFAGSASEPYDDVYPELHFDSRGKKVAYCARKGAEIWWIVQDVK